MAYPSPCAELTREHNEHESCIMNFDNPETWHRDGLPNEEWEALLMEAKRRADAAGHFRISSRKNWRTASPRSPGRVHRFRHHCLVSPQAVV